MVSFNLLLISSFTGLVAASQPAAGPWYIDFASSAFVDGAVSARKNGVPSATASSIAAKLIGSALAQPQATEVGSILINNWAKNGPSINPSELSVIAQAVATEYSSVKNKPEYSSYVKYAQSEATNFNLNLPTITATGADAAKISQRMEQVHEQVISAYSSLNADPQGHQAIQTLESVYSGYYKDFIGTPPAPTHVLRQYVADKIISLFA